MSEAAVAIEAEPPVTPAHPRTRSPYLGLDRFEESDAYRFHGRAEASRELARLVRRNQVTVLFGASGLGKSSLLRAGLYPIIRDEGFLPVTLRLDFHQGAPPLLDQVWSAFTAEVTEVKADATRREPGESLRDYFRRTEIWSARNRLLVAVLVFDQFEELFTLGERRSREEIDELVAQLADLVEDHRDETQARPSLSPVRVVMALREDFLARFEDLRTQMPSIMVSRFHLGPMTGRQALDAVYLPATEIVDEDVARHIVRFVADAEEYNDELVVEPALLSLVCAELDEIRMGAKAPKISKEMIGTGAAEIVKRFYNRSFASLHPAMRQLVEQSLVTDDGYRTTIAVPVACMRRGVTKEQIRKLEERRILREEDRFGLPHIELIHDLLTGVAVEGRVQAQRQAFSRRLILTTLVVGAAIFIIFVSVAFWVVRKKNEEDDKRDEAAAAAHQARTTGNMLTEQGRRALLRGEPANAAQLLHEAKKAFAVAEVMGTDAVTRAIADVTPVDVNMMLTRAIAELSGLVRTIEHPTGLTCARFIDDTTLVTCGADASIRLWSWGYERNDSEVVSIQPVREDPVGAPATQISVAIGGRSRWILAVSDGGSAQIVDTGGVRLAVLEPPPSLSQQALAPQDLAQQARTSTAWEGCIADDDGLAVVWSKESTDQYVWTLSQDTTGTGLRAESHVISGNRPDAVTCLRGRGLLIASKQGGAQVRRIDDDGRWQQTEHVGERVVTSSDGEVVASLLTSEVGRVLAIRRGREHRYAWAPSGLSTLSVSNDWIIGTVAASWGDQDYFSSWAQGVVVWDADTGQMVFSVDRRLPSAKLTDDGKALVIASEGRLEVWNPDGWQLRFQRSLEVGATPVVLDAFGDFESSGKVVVADGSRARVFERSAQAGGDRVVLAVPVAAAPWRVISDGTALLSPEEDAVAVLRDDGHVVMTRFGAETSDAPPSITDTRIKPSVAPALERVAWLRAGAELGILEKGELCRWAVSGKPVKPCIKTRLTAKPARVVGHPRAPLALAIDVDGNLSIIDLVAGTARPVATAGSKITSASFAWDGRAVAVVSTEGKAAVLYPGTDRPAVELSLDGANAVRWTRSGHVVASSEDEVEVRDSDGEPVLELYVEGAFARDAIAVPAGRRQCLTPCPGSDVEVVWLCGRYGCSAHDPDGGHSVARLRANLEDARLSPLGAHLEGSLGLLILPAASTTGQVTSEGYDARYVQSSIGGGPAAAMHDHAGNVYVWDGETTTQLPNSGGASADPVFNSSGMLATSSDNEVLLRSADGATTKSAWTGRAAIAAVAWDPGTTFVAVDQSFRVAAVDATTAKERVSVDIDGFRAGGRLPTFDPDGSRYADVALDGAIELRAVEDERVLGTYPLGGPLPDKLEIARSPSTALATLTSGKVTVWPAAGQPPRTFPGRFDDIRLAADGRHLVALDSDRSKATVWSLVANVEPKTVDATAIDIDDRGMWMLAKHPEETTTRVYAFEGDDGSFLKQIDRIDELPDSEPVFAPRGEHILFPETGVIRRVRVDAREYSANVGGAALAYAFSGDGRHALVVRSGGVVALMTLDSGRRDTQPAPDAILRSVGIGLLAPVAGHSDDRMALQVPSDTGITVLTWHGIDLASLRSIEVGWGAVRLGAAEDDVWTLRPMDLLTRWSSSGRQRQLRPVHRVLATAIDGSRVRVAVADSNGKIDVLVVAIALAGGPMIIPLRGESPVDVSLAAFDPSGDKLAVAFEDGSVALFDSGRKDPMRMLVEARSRTHAAPISAMAFAPDAERVVVGRVDGTVDLLSSAGAAVGTLRGHGGAVTDLDFDEKGEWLASASFDGTVRVWDLDSKRALIKLEPIDPDSIMSVSFGGVEGRQHVIAGTIRGQMLVWSLISTLPNDQSIQDLIARSLPNDDVGGPSP